MKAMYDDRDVTHDKWPEVAMDSISVKAERRKKERVLGARHTTRVFLLCQRSNYVSVKGKPMGENRFI